MQRKTGNAKQHYFFVRQTCKFIAPCELLGKYWCI